MDDRIHLIEVLGTKHEKLGYHSDKVENRYVTVVEATRYPSKARAAVAAAELLAQAPQLTYVALVEV